MSSWAPCVVVGCYCSDGGDSEATHSLCKVSHATDRWWNQMIINSSSSPWHFLPILIISTIWGSTKLPCTRSSSVTALCNHALLLQLKEVDSLSVCLFFEYFLFKLSLISLELLQAKVIHKVDVCQCLVSSEIRALHCCNRRRRTSEEGKLGVPPKQQVNHSSPMPALCCSVCLFAAQPGLGPRIRVLTCCWPVADSFSETMEFVYEIPVVTYSTPVKVSTIIILCLLGFWYIFMSRYKLATLLILLSKQMWWHKSTKNAIIITTHLSRKMLPVNMCRSCCCNSASIDHHAPHWKVGGAFSGVMDGMTRQTLEGESCFNGKDNFSFSLTVLLKY